MRAMVQAADIRGTPVVVRVPWNEPGVDHARARCGRGGRHRADGQHGRGGRAGGRGLPLPAARLPELGPAALLGMAEPGFDPRRGNEQSVCLVMIETIEAVENLEAILEVPGVDGVLVGPNDLAISHTGTNARRMQRPHGTSR